MNRGMYAYIRWIGIWIDGFTVCMYAIYACRFACVHAHGCVDAAPDSDLRYVWGRLGVPQPCRLRSTLSCGGMLRAEGWRDLLGVRFRAFRILARV